MTSGGGGRQAFPKVGQDSREAMMSTLFIKQKIFSVGGKFTVFDERQQFFQRPLSFTSHDHIHLFRFQ